MLEILIFRKINFEIVNTRWRIITDKFYKKKDFPFFGEKYSKYSKKLFLKFKSFSLIKKYSELI